MGAHFALDSHQAIVGLGVLGSRLRAGGARDIKLDLGLESYDFEAGGRVFRVRNDVLGNIHHGAGHLGLRGNAERHVLNPDGFVGDRPLNPLVGSNSPADDFATRLGYEVDVGSTASTAASIEVVLRANIEQFAIVSATPYGINGLVDNAVYCVSGC